MNTLLALTAIVLVSFGTSFEDSRQATIVAVERDVQDAYPDAYVVSAYTSTIIRKKLLQRDGTKIFSVEEALEDVKERGLKNVIIQPTHLMYGIEYNEMISLSEPYAEYFDNVFYGAPLLASTEDISRVLNALSEANPLKKNEALVLMGHGSEYFSNFLYAAVDYQAKAEGHKNIFVGTVEAYPSIEEVLRLTKEAKIKKVTLTPLMLVSGDHANNDMAGDEEDSWKNRFIKAGFKTETLLKGLGEYPEIRRLYIEHIAQAMRQ